MNMASPLRGGMCRDVQKKRFVLWFST
uniref:Uncharacterized protein n=1 Tax=Anguilla anguilla TaxID=7936 RepID=A0A0E9T5Y3_ANGAN